MLYHLKQKLFALLFSFILKKKTNQTSVPLWVTVREREIWKESVRTTILELSKKSSSISRPVDLPSSELSPPVFFLPLLFHFFLKSLDFVYGFLKLFVEILLTKIVYWPDSGFLLLNCYGLCCVGWWFVLRFKDNILIDSLVFLFFGRCGRVFPAMRSWLGFLYLSLVFDLLPWFSLYKSFYLSQSASFIYWFWFLYCLHGLSCSIGASFVVFAFCVVIFLWLLALWLDYHYHTWFLCWSLNTIWWFLFRNFSVLIESS